MLNRSQRQPNRNMICSNRLILMKLGRLLFIFRVNFMLNAQILPFFHTAWFHLFNSLDIYSSFHQFMILQIFTVFFPMQICYIIQSSVCFHSQLFYSTSTAHVHGVLISYHVNLNSSHTWLLLIVVLTFFLE